jgi:hypothetical protein
MESPPQLPDTRPSLETLLSEFDGWSKTLDRDTDDFDTIAKMVALYKFAIVHYNDPGSDLLLDAIVAVEAAQKDRS